MRETLRNKKPCHKGNRLNVTGLDANSPPRVPQSASSSIMSSSLSPPSSNSPTPEPLLRYRNIQSQPVLSPYTDPAAAARAALSSYQQPEVQLNRSGTRYRNTAQNRAGTHLQARTLRTASYAKPSRAKETPKPRPLNRSISFAAFSSAGPFSPLSSNSSIQEENFTTSAKPSSSFSLKRTATTLSKRGTDAKNLLRGFKELYIAGPPGDGELLRRFKHENEATTPTSPSRAATSFDISRHEEQLQSRGAGTPRSPYEHTDGDIALRLFNEHRSSQEFAESNSQSSQANSADLHASSPHTRQQNKRRPSGADWKNVSYSHYDTRSWRVKQPTGFRTRGYLHRLQTAVDKNEKQRATNKLKQMISTPTDVDLSHPQWSKWTNTPPVSGYGGHINQTPTIKEESRSPYTEHSSTYGDITPRVYIDRLPPIADAQEPNTDKTLPLPPPSVREFTTDMRKGHDGRRMTLMSDFLHTSEYGSQTRAAPSPNLTLNTNVYPVDTPPRSPRSALVAAAVQRALSSSGTRQQNLQGGSAAAATATRKNEALINPTSGSKPIAESIIGLGIQFSNPFLSRRGTMTSTSKTAPAPPPRPGLATTQSSGSNSSSSSASSSNSKRRIRRSNPCAFETDSESDAYDTELDDISPIEREKSLAILEGRDCPRSPDSFLNYYGSRKLDSYGGSGFQMNSPDDDDDDDRLSWSDIGPGPHGDDQTPLVETYVSPRTNWI